MNSRLLYWFIFLVSGCLCALIISPAAEAVLGGSGIWAAAARLAFFKFCHQDPERSFWILGACLPVCCRCTGIFAGFFLGWIAWRLVPEKRRDRPVSTTVLAIGLAPLVVDGMLNTLRLVSSPNLFRFATGLMFGAMAARALWPALLEAAAAMGLAVKGSRGVSPAVAQGQDKGN